MKTVSNTPARTKRQQLISLAAVCVTLAVAAFALLTSPAARSAAEGPKERDFLSAHGEDPGAEPSAAPQGDDKEPAPSEGCMKCHAGVGDPHVTKIRNGPSCVDCHGGNGTAQTVEAAHTAKPKHPEKWHGAANPEESFTLLNKENWDWIKFVNPSDLRVAHVSCGKCHDTYVRSVKKSAMSTSAQVFSTGLYNNGSVPNKDALFAESYSPHGQAQALRTIPPPTEEDRKNKGILPILFPLPRFEMGQPLSVAWLRVFERGGGPKSELGNPNREDVPGQPDESF